MTNLEEVAFIKIEKAAHALGFQNPALIDKKMRASMNTLASFDEFASLCLSPARTKELEAFAISTHSFALETLLIPEVIEKLYDCENIETLAAAVDACLYGLGLRLPTEDEYEAALGPRFFPWGDEVPAQADTLETWLAKVSSQSELVFNKDPYDVELCRGALKGGDGGEALCGGYPWPFVWLPFARAYRVPEVMMMDAFEAFIECLRVRPVRVTWS